MRTNQKTLVVDEIKLLSRHFKSLHFRRDFSFVYENQIPNIGIVLVKGVIEFKKRDETKEIISQPVALGIKQLLSQKPSREECLLRGQSEVILISKSELLEIQKNHPELSGILF